MPSPDAQGPQEDTLFPLAEVSRGGPVDPDQFRLTLMALSLVQGVGEATITGLVRRLPNLPLLWELPADELRGVLVKSVVGSARKGVVEQIVRDRDKLREAGEASLRRLASQGTRLLIEHDADYPTQLRALPDRPLWLFVQGSTELLSRQNLVAVVGTRDASPAGARLTRELTTWLALRGVGIVSGLAEGIDATAHETALDFGAPCVAVLGTGILQVFPASTAPLRERLLSRGGAVVTEYFPSDSYSRQRFVKRNRIQAGLAVAVVPVEGRESSGTAHTYQFARKYGRITLGVTSGDLRPAPGLIDVLRKDGVLILDLAQPDQLARLAECLRIPVEPQDDVRAAGPTDVVLAEFVRVLDRYPVSQQDLAELQQRLTQTWNRARHGR